MKKKTLESYTKKIIVLDNLINWFIGIALLFFTRFSRGLLSENMFFPMIFWKGLGLVFLVFAAWQDYTIAKGISKTDYRFASVMAILPVIGLSYALLFMDLGLFYYTEIALWLGNIYMAVLGAWYWFVSSK
ncbi:hypothetical protein JXB41_06885 [Candidatus Woesearchaeota archaeon]|nr:hypothetical protein [Candidatus Woesearchaeota archaeon]